MNTFIKDPAQTISGLLESMYFNLTSVSGQINTMAVGSGQPSSRKFVVDLPSGIDNHNIEFPYPCINPVVTCEFENNQDNLIYNYSLNNVTSSGFGISFSDILINNYKLHVNW